ncbi:DUF2997 domain-containing protein [Synechococcus sp. C9]|jgi:hypothetical protein|uniref:DUF2997 domain-containing protein n=1 Tax=Synechococcus sp. C9 TaxID=102119 RepID=UPI001FF683AB|nr:DUF2997 domain-containing protein [Synechococcus sp. C9]
MAEYQQVEYTIDKDGNITEKVLNATGASCLDLTAEVEAALGVVEQRELLPSYYETPSATEETTNEQVSQIQSS